MTNTAAALNAGRMLSDGIPYADLAAARAALERGDDWFALWSAKADDYERLGERALAEGHGVSAGQWLWHASLSIHYAQFMWFHDPARREAGQRRKVELYRRAAPHLRPAAERVDIPFAGVTIPGYLRLPEGDGPFPCAVLIGGLESTKEESLLFENLCLARGMATFAFDGPGQGELFFDAKLGPGFERYSSAVVDHLVERPEIDASRLGVLGRSLGGHYAPRAAAADERFRVAVAWGACFDLSDLDTMPEATRRGFLYASGADDVDAGLAHLRQSIDLTELAPRLRAPLYVLHGRHDAIFSMAQVDRFREAFAHVPLVIDVEDDGDHCCHNMGQVVRPRMADWLADHLAAR
ncbi:MAG TPA: alpha/beta hydrolase [Solirubrobacteraceae bacterium]|nr:alpha/beta hydrolase [Solirubrobacteraceae bacterium]